MSSEAEWKEVWEVVVKLANTYEDVIFIGGVAVNAHMVNREDATVGLGEFSHDVDLCISLAEFGDLRDFEIVTPNRRLNKHQISINNVEVDVYVEHGHRLAVPYGDMMAASEVFDGIRVAGLNHLMILKLDAAQDRWNTPKGAKDRRDIAKIGWAIGGDANTELLAGYLNEARLTTLRDTARSTAFSEIALGNAHTAKLLRSRFDAFMKRLTSDSDRPASSRRTRLR